MKNPNAITARMNGHLFDQDVDLNEFESQIISNIQDLQYWSPSALLDLRKGLAEMVIEAGKEARSTASGQEKTKLTRIINSTKKYLDYTPKPENILAHLYEKVLKTEAKGQLRGFGFASKYGDKLTGNAEKRSIR